MTPLVMVAVGRDRPDSIQAIAETHGIDVKSAAEHYHHARQDRVYENCTYRVIVRMCPDYMNLLMLPNLMWLSIRRIDGEPVRSWPDLQAIKNQLLGPESEAFESFPAESRKVDAANQYHLFGGPNLPPLAGFPRPQS